MCLGTFIISGNIETIIYGATYAIVKYTHLDGS